MEKHAHDHRHPGHGHAHNHGGGKSDSWRIGATLAITTVFMLVEIAGGILSHSLALIADAGHMVSDAAALGMAWLAIHVGKRPADAARSYGYKRLEVLAAFVNGCALFLIAGWVAVEALRRFADPQPVLGGTMMVVAVACLIANLITFRVLHGGNRANLNVRGAWLHVVGDLLGSVAAIAAACIILWTGWYPADPLLSLFVVLIILKGAYGIVRSSAHILLEGVPEGLSVEAMRRDLISALPAGTDIHHVHAWSLTVEDSFVTMHVRCAPGADSQSLIAAINHRLKDRFHIGHSTIQVEDDRCSDRDA